MNLLRSPFLCLTLTALGIGLALLGSSCSRPETSTADGELPLVIVQLDWVPESQHGGLFQAIAKGYFVEEGLQVEVLSGGNNVSVIESVAVGQADIGQSASTQIISAVARGLPLTNLVSVFHQLPTALLMREDHPVQSFQDLQGLTVMARPEAHYLTFIRNKYQIDFNVVPQNFGLGGLIHDPLFIQEGFFIAEPYYLEKAGVKVRYLPLWEAGYEVYAVLFANKRFLQRHPDRAAAFVRAFLRGWQDYLEGDPAPAHQAIREARRGAVEEAFLDFSRSMIIEENLAKGDPAKGEDYGSLDPQRIAREIRLLEDLGSIPRGEVTVDQVLYQPVD